MFAERMSVGLDVHARSVVAAAIDTVTDEVVTARLCPAEVLDWVAALPQPVAVAYEAGPTGYGLARAFTAAGVRCVVAAPSHIVRPAGDRVKTDARDAKLLARLLRLGDLVAVRVPSIEQEAARDLTRARDGARAVLTTAKHRLTHLALRHGHVYSGGTPWTQQHLRWLRHLSFDQAGTRAAFDDAYAMVMFTLARRDELDAQIEQMALTSSFTPMVRRLCCLRGIATLTGFAIAVELGDDWSRFTPGSLAAFVGLAPGEASSGDKRVVTSITKAGNSHVRRLLIEAAWHHKPAYQPGNTLMRRWNHAPGPVVAAAHQGNKRLHKRWQAFDARHKRPVIANTAIARELAGWCHTLVTL